MLPEYSPSPPRTPPRLRRPRRSSRRSVWLCAAAAVAAALAGCGGPSASSSSSAPAAGVGDARNLRAAGCPDPVVIQDGWFPTADAALGYGLLGDGYRVDAGGKRVSGRLVADGVDTGVGLEIRSGGPAIGFQTVSAQMYLDKSITLGTVNTDEAVLLSAGQATTAVVAQLDGDPQILLWDPVTYPGFNTIRDVGQTDVKVVYYSANVYMNYLTGTGILRAGQVDGSYDGSPSRFVSARGRVVVQGYVTNEPWLYEHEVPAWGRPVGYQLVRDTGYPDYANPLAIRAGDRQKLAGCLRRLVPMLQRAQVAFLTNPDPTLARIVEVVRKFHTSFTYTGGNAEHAVRTLTDLGLVGNGANHTLGDFDPRNVQRILDIVTPIAAGQKKPIKAGLTIDDVATDQFIDPAIGLPSK